ncbi:MAG TPA: MbcA/ParS/Xre antitoxin family protein [Candidatus Acidoferrum sp.]|nr:MbcA/ParS/Xre antitoxin family protein [Candidatus Acidoferrum sp.]
MATKKQHRVARQVVDLGSRLDLKAAPAIVSRALEVFGDGARALEWLLETNSALNGDTPMNVIRTEAGRREVLNILGRIEYGVIS